MKQLSGATLFVVAIVCGLIAAGLTVFYMQQIDSKYRQAAQPPKLETQRVVMVRKNMLKGEKIREADIGAMLDQKRFNHECTTRICWADGGSPRWLTMIMALLARRSRARPGRDRDLPHRPVTTPASTPLETKRFPCSQITPR